MDGNVRSNRNSNQNVNFLGIASFTPILLSGVCFVFVDYNDVEVCGYKSQNTTHIHVLDNYANVLNISETFHFTLPATITMPMAHSLIIKQICRFYFVWTCVERFPSMSIVRTVLTMKHQIHPNGSTCRKTFVFQEESESCRRIVNPSPLKVVLL